MLNLGSEAPELAGRAEPPSLSPTFYALKRPGVNDNAFFIDQEGMVISAVDDW